MLQINGIFSFMYLFLTTKKLSQYKRVTVRFSFINKTYGYLMFFLRNVRQMSRLTRAPYLPILYILSFLGVLAFILCLCWHYKSYKYTYNSFVVCTLETLVS